MSVYELLASVGRTTGRYAHKELSRGSTGTVPKTAGASTRAKTPVNYAPSKTVS